MTLPENLPPFPPQVGAYAERMEPRDAICEPVAIIGMACRWPGSCDTPSALWDLLASKRSAQCPIPPSRFNVASFYHPERERPGSINTAAGFFLQEDPRDFDPSFFNISVVEASSMDPQQRKLLEVVYEALEAGGQKLDTLAGSRTGVYVGNFSWEHSMMILKDAENLPAYATTGYGVTILSNRISYTFGLTGPSLTIDTACSSSLYALHLACTALESGDCTSAIVGGVNLVLGPEGQMSSVKLGVLSPSSTCHSFDADADGYARGDGVGAIYLKKLSDALRDRDPIRAVIRGTAVNANGRTGGGGMSHPSVKAQEDVIRRAYQRAGLTKELHNTGYFECHGTGTAVGDPLEVNAVAKVFAAGRSQEKPLLVGSVKSNLGHGEASSGLAGVMKAVLALEKGEIPATIGVRQLNRNIDFRGGRVKVVTETTPWPSHFPVKRVSINSFGYGGANSHAILETVESMVPGYARKTAIQTIGAIKKTPSGGRKRKFILPFSAHDKDTLQEFVRALAPIADSYDPIDLTYTLTCRRSKFFFRGFAVAEEGNMMECLGDVAFSEKLKGGERGIVFVFTGQGAQWKAMGRSLIQEVPVFARTIKELDQVLKNLPTVAQRPNGWTLEDLLLGSTACNIDEPAYAQPLCTALQIGIINTLRSWDIRPSAAIGHSSGEIAAAYASGLLSQAEAIIIAYYRGYAIANTEKHSCEGMMAAVGLSVEEVEPYLLSENIAGKVVIACHNSPESVTLSGDKSALEEVMERMKNDEKSVFVRGLRTGGAAYHSFHMKRVGELYEACLQAALPSLAAAGGRTEHLICQMYSTVDVSDGITGMGGVGPSYWRKNLESRVVFGPAMESLFVDHGFKLVVEIGPHSVLSGPIRQITKKAISNPREVVYIPSILRNADTVETLLALAGELWIRDVPVDLTIVNGLSSKESKVIIDLPTYKWNYRRLGLLWTESRLSREFRFRNHPRHDLLGSRIPGTAGTWRNLINVENSGVGWLEMHKLGTQVVFPAAGYLAMAAEAVLQLAEGEGKKEVGHVMFRNVALKVALPIPKGGAEVIFNVTPTKLSNVVSSTKWYDFTISSIEADGPEGNRSRWTEHCSGTVGLDIQRESSKYDTRVPQVAFHYSSSNIKWYETFGNCGMNYGPSFAQLGEIKTNPKVRQAVGAMPIVPAHKGITDESRYLVHPTTIDMCLQMTIIAGHSGLTRNMKSGYVPVFFERMTMWPPATGGGNQFGSCKAYGERIGPKEKLIGDCELRDSHGNVLLEIEGLQITPYTAGSKTEGKIQRNPYLRVVWKPDAQVLTCSKAKELYGRERPMLPAVQEGLQEDCREMLQRLAGQKVSFQSWLHNQLRLTGTDDFSLLATSLAAQTPELSRYILSLQSSEDFIPVPDTLVASYFNSAAFAPTRNHLIQIIDLLSHKKPTVRVLELGGGSGELTEVILETMHNLEEKSFKRYSKYVFTDKGEENFATVREKIGAWPAVELKRLNIANQEKLETSESDDGIFDLVVAVNMASIQNFNMISNLANARKMLKRGGRLLALTMTEDSLAQRLFTGVVNEVWRTGELLKPYSTLDEWSRELKSTGFSGVDIELKSPLGPSLILTTAIPAPEDVAVEGTLEQVLIMIHRNNILSLTPVIERLATEAGFKILHTSLQSTPEIDPIIFRKAQVVVTAELEGSPVFTTMDETEFRGIQYIMEHSHSVLWLTEGSYIEGTRPEHAMMPGLARTIMAEQPALQLYTMDISIGSCESNTKHIAGLVFNHVRHMQIAKKSPEEVDDYHLCEKDGMLYVSRIIPDPKANIEFTGSVNEEKDMVDFFSMPMRMRMEQVGMLDSIYFVEDEKHYDSLAQGYVEIEVKAVGMNAKDTYIAMGYFDSKDKCQSDDFFNIECAGIVARVAPDVTDLKIGDRVVCLGFGHYGTYSRVPAATCQKISDTDDIEEVATMPTVFCTAIHAFKNLARLEKCQTVLIQSAAGGLGIAAIQVAQMLGAEIYVTVSSQHKREFLTTNFNIPDSHIFYSRDSSFVEDVLKVTSGKGVDVLLTSAAGDIFYNSFKCVADYGMLIDVGRRETLDNGRLGMEVFKRGITLTSFDLNELGWSKPQVHQKLLAHMMDLYNAKRIRPIFPIKRYDISELSLAMRYFSTGHHTGKIVITYNNPSSKVRSLKNNDKLRFRTDCSYLLIGALGGLGRSLCQWMVSRGARNLIFISRSGAGAPNSPASLLLQDLEAAGVRVQMIRGDVTNIDDIRRTMTVAEKPIRGVVMGAMVVEHGVFTQLKLGDYKKVIKPKIEGSFALHEAFKNEELDFFVMMSSLAGSIGVPSESAYCGANAVMDSIARHRHSQGLPVTSLALGMITEVGYISERAEREQGLTRAGLYGIPEAEFLRAMELAMANCTRPPLEGHVFERDDGANSYVLMGMEPLRLKELHKSGFTGIGYWKKDGRFSVIANELQKDLEGGTNITQQHTAMEELKKHAKTSSPEQVKTKLSGIFFEKLSNLLLLQSVDQLDTSKTAAEYGMDSIIGAELRHWLHRELGIEMSHLDLLAPISIAELAGRAYDKLDMSLKGVKG